MNFNLSRYVVVMSFMISTVSVAKSVVPDISCRQGNLQVNNSNPSIDRKKQAKEISTYLKELDSNIFLDHEPAWLQDDFQIKNIHLASYDKTIIPQKVTDQVETRLVFEKDPADDTCFLMQQTTLDKSPKPKKTKVKVKAKVKKAKAAPVNVVYRACLTTLTKGQTIFNKHSKVADQKTRKTTYPYTICTINNDSY